MHKMPSCVIKNCKNTSALHTKHGVSFHKLPRDPVLQCKWTSVIRVDRNDKKWVPSKFTTVCSAHFDDKDLYQTENGLQRVMKNAIPKKNLNGSRITCSDIQDTNKDNPEDSDNSSKSLECTTSKLEPAIQVLIPESSELNDLNDISRNDITKSNKSQSENDSSESNDDKNSCSDSDIDSIERPHEVLLEREKRKHKKTKLNNRRKIKTLTQKVRRLKNQNKSLKLMLKGIKDKYLIDPKIEKSPTLNEVSLEIFRNIYVNRKKKVHYSPAVRKFCLTLSSYSPKAYEYVREMLGSSLPHPKTLTKWTDITIETINTTCTKDKQTIPDDFSSEDDYTTEIPEQYLAGHHYPQQTQYPAIQHEYQTIEATYSKEQNQYSTDQQSYISKPQDGYSAKQYEYPSQLPVP